MFRSALRLFLIFALFACSAPLWASSPLSGFNGARPLSLGNAYTAQADDAYAFYVDPAGLTELKLFNIFSTYSQLDSNRTFSSLGVVAPNNLFGLTLGFGYRRLALTGLVDVSGNPVDFNEQEIALALAKEVSEGFSFGAELRYINLGQSTGSSSADASGRALDLAVRRVYQPWLRLALSAQDMAGRLDYQDGTAVNLPINLVAGISLDLLGRNALVRNSNQLTLNLDVSENQGNPMLLHAGVEWRPIELIALRGGVDQNFGEAQGTGSSGIIFNNFTAGLGLHYGGLTLDYAMQRNGDVSGDVTNYISLSYAYVEATEEAPAAAPPVEFAKELPDEFAPGTVEAPVRRVKLKHFPDVPSDFWASKEIEQLSTAGIMWGYADGFFHPQRRVTRGEFETILSAGRHLTLVRVSHEARPVTRAQAAARLGLKGKIDRPQATVTRAELARLIYQTDWAQTALKRLPPFTE